MEQILVRMDEQEDGQQQLQTAMSDLMQTLEQTCNSRKAADVRLAQLEESVNSSLEATETRFKDLENEVAVVAGVSVKQQAAGGQAESQLKSTKIQVEGLERNLRDLEANLNSQSEEWEGRLGTLAQGLESRLAGELAKQQATEQSQFQSTESHIAGFEAEMKTQLKSTEARLAEIKGELAKRQGVETTLQKQVLQVQTSIIDVEGDLRSSLQDIEKQLANQMKQAESYVEGLKEDLKDDLAEKLENANSSLKKATETRLTKIEGTVASQQPTNGYNGTKPQLNSNTPPTSPTSAKSPRGTTSPSSKARGSSLMGMFKR